MQLAFCSKSWLANFVPRAIGIDDAASNSPTLGVPRPAEAESTKCPMSSAGPPPPCALDRIESLTKSPSPTAASTACVLRHVSTIARDLKSNDNGMTDGENHMQRRKLSTSCNTSMKAYGKLDNAKPTKNKALHESHGEQELQASWKQPGSHLVCSCQHSKGSIN